MARSLSLLIGLLLVVPALLADTPRRTIILHKGQKSVVATQGSVITVTSPPGSSDKVLKWTFEQYGGNLALAALSAGEVKLMVEYTDARIGEILNVVVTEKKTWDRYRETVGAISGIEGLGEQAVQVAGDRIVITGTVWSMDDLKRCESLGSKPSKGKPVSPQVVCAVRLSAAAPVVFPDRGAIARANVEVIETYDLLQDEATKGKESSSSWRAVIRLGDVPVAETFSANRTDGLRRAADCAATLNRITGEWQKRAESSTVPFPVTFRVNMSGTKRTIGMQWRSDQGSRGDTVLELGTTDLDRASRAAGKSPDEVTQWWSALMQDAFRLYNIAQRPLLSITGAERPPLVALYETSVKLAGTLDRARAAAAVSRGFYAMKVAASGNDPFETLLTNIPGSGGQSH